MLDACKDVLYRFRDEGIENFRGKGRKKRTPKSGTHDHSSPNAVASSSNIGKRRHRNERGKRSSAVSKMLVDETEDSMISSEMNTAAQLQHRHHHRQRRDETVAKPSIVTPVNVKKAAKSTSFQEADEIIRIDFFREGETEEDDDSNEISYASKHSAKRSDDFPKLEYHSDDDRRSLGAERRNHRRTNRQKSEDLCINDERRADDGRRQSKRPSHSKKQSLLLDDQVSDEDRFSRIGGDGARSKARLADAENSQIEINLV
uniref:Uncharacterized protein n=1 Tax=Romanomermis culicivorax TaxID=13658 RepID=A0A915HF43_ROMCU